MDKKTIRPESTKKDLISRLNRIEGQIRGMNKMIEDNRNCADILVQISAVNSALKSLGQELLENHMKTCMVNDIKNERLESINEVMDLCRKLV